MKKTLPRVGLLLFSLYIIIGNLSRIIPIFSNRDNLSILEPILYLYALICLFLYGKVLNFISRFYFIISIIILSSLIGIVKYGVDFQSNLYAVRLVFMILSGYMYAFLFYKVVDKNLIKFMRIIVSIYFVNIIFGYVILALFPDSVELWMTLNMLGIGFQGDPHQSRFISTYLDPNFFAVIICMPIICTSVLIDVDKRMKKVYYFLFVSFFITGIYSFSRSGIAILFMTLFILYRYKIKDFLFKHRLDYNLIYALLGGFLICILFVGTQPDLFERYSDRFTNISDDNSALNRKKSLDIAIDVINEDPLTGIGYNYFRHLMATNPFLAVAPDSSLALMVCCFGVILSCAISIYVLIHLYIKYNKTNNVISKNYILYILLCIFFSSWFNELLDYQYWLIPVLTILGFIVQYGYSYEKQNRNGWENKK